MKNEWKPRVDALCVEAAELATVGDRAGAWRNYVDALNLLPQPDYEQLETVQILKGMGELQWLKPDIAKALGVFQDAVRCRGGLGDPQIHLRLGQCQYELGDMNRAADELARAYMGGGREIFADEDPKYFALVESVLKPPIGHDRLP